MAVYVDSMQAAYRNMIMCHMMADTHEELLAMATKIGVKHKWLQYPGKYAEHFDICLNKRALAVKYGAKEITWKEAGMLLAKRLEQSKLTNDVGNMEGH